MNENKPWKRAAALALAAALVLSGCGGKDDDKKADSTPAPAESVEPTPEERDFSKYNAYIDMADELNDLEDVVNAYFRVVDYTEEFTVMDGANYADIKEDLQFYTANKYPVTEAQEYVDEDPAYPSVDAAVRALGDSPIQVMQAMDDISGYVRFHDYEDDNLAKAPELHAALWKALEVYDTYYSDFINAIDEMVEEGQAEDEKRLLEEGEMVLYHSNCIINASKEVLSILDDQVYAAYMEAVMSGAETFDYPTIDMTELTPLFDKIKTSYDGFKEDMASEEEKEKVFSGPQAESASTLYNTRVTYLCASMTALSEALTAGTDYADAWETADEAVSTMISAYNNVI